MPQISPGTYWCGRMYVCILSPTHVRLFAISWTVAHQAPLSMEFSRQEYWSGLLFHTPEHLPDPGIKPVSLASSLSQMDSLPLYHLGRHILVLKENVWNENEGEK